MMNLAIKTNESYSHWIIPGATESLSVEDLPDIVKSLTSVRSNNKSRLRELVISRQIGMSLAYIFSNKPLGEVGRMFGKEHSTVIHALKCIAISTETGDKLITENLIPIFKKYYRNHVENIHNYVSLSLEQRAITDEAVKRLKKYTFTKTLIRLRNDIPD